MTVARCYARLSKSKCEINCPHCQHRYIPIDPLAEKYVCPQCYGKATHTLIPNSIQAQKHGLMQYTRPLFEKGLFSDVLFYADVISAKVDFAKRPQGGRLLHDLKKGDHLIVIHFDRAWRSVPNFYHTLEICLRMKVGIHMVEQNLDLSTPMGEALGGLLAIFAQLERRMISERTRRGKRFLKDQGRPQNGLEGIGFEHFCKACGHRLPKGGGKYNQHVRACPCGAVRRENTELRVSTIDHAIMRLMLGWVSPRHYRTITEVVQQLKDDGIKNPKTLADFNYRSCQMWLARARELEPAGNLLPLPNDELWVRNWLPEAIGQRGAETPNPEPATEPPANPL